MQLIKTNSSTRKYIIGILSYSEIHIILYLSETTLMHAKLIPEHQQKRMEEIRSFIKNSRINDGYTQSELGGIANLHVNSIQRFENGINRNISLLTLFSLIDALEMPLSEFFADME